VIGEEVVLKKEEPILLYEPPKNRPDPFQLPAVCWMPARGTEAETNYGQYSEIFQKSGDGTATERLPLLPLRDIVVFPHMVAPLFVGRNKSVSALSSAMNKDKRIFLATQKMPAWTTPRQKDICDVGVIGTVLQLLRLPDGTVKALIEGKQRARIEAILPNPEFFEVELSLLPDIPRRHHRG
jgi:ATP-dependent Lon protease